MRGNASGALDGAADRPSSDAAPSEHVEVLIVGAGISGIGSAYHLAKEMPELSYVVLEAQHDFGGTWLTHRYPGTRSDSDLHTFGYRFKPWTSAPIATAAEIRAYMGEVIAENDLARHIRYRHRIVSATWSSADNLWTLTGTRGDADGRDDPVRFTTNFLWMCQGYYRHDEGYTPDWPGMAAFGGLIVHPQTWPDDLDLSGKRVVVIGSGATAATLIPSIADDCAELTMLQRSPTFFRTGRNAIEMAEELRRLQIDETWIHEIVRRKTVYEQHVFAQRAADKPDAVKKDLLDGVRAVLPEGYDIDMHFTPRYRPWRQRIAFVPDADLFESIRSGKARVVTDEIERFTADGLVLKSGATLDADIVVTATGFHLSVLGGIAFAIDGEPLDLANSVSYRGMMFTGVPNLVWVFGYLRASWTLRVDIVADFVVRLLRHMRAKGVARVEPALRPEDADMTFGPWIDPEDFNPGYMMREMHRMPKSGSKREWRHTQDYWNERNEFPAIDLEDAAFVYR